MVTTWWEKISNLGITKSTPDSEKRNYILANKLNFLLLLSSVLLTLLTAIFRQIHNNEFSIHTKKILFITILALINQYISYREKHKFMRFNLVVFPILITVTVPILMGYVQEMDIFIAPLAIICLSLIPITILYPDFKRLTFSLAFIYFLIHVFFLDNALKYFAKGNIMTFSAIPNFQFYFKISFLSVFLFIYFVLYYYRRLNFSFEKEIRSINSELKNNIEELKATQEQLIQTEKMASLGILTAGVAHEINNPLNFISGAYEGMRIHYEETACCLHHDEVGHLLKNLKSGVDKVSGIVKSLRQFSRDNNDYEEDCLIHQILENCITMLNNQLKHRIQIEKQYYNGEEVVIKGNAGKLHQVFLNILSNASDAISHKGNIKLTTVLKNKNVIIEISDSGEGINKENLKKITDPFFTTKAPGKGTGLGLSIAYNIIQKHRGAIEFESEPEKGTVVRVILPIKRIA